MFVKINSSSGCEWYNDRIGEIFEVEFEFVDCYNSNMYKVNNNIRFNSYIRHDDCEEVKPIKKVRSNCDDFRITSNKEYYVFGIKIGEIDNYQIMNNEGKLLSYSVSMFDDIDDYETHYGCISIGGHIPNPNVQLQALKTYGCGDITIITKDKIYDGFDVGKWYYVKTDIGTMQHLSKDCFTIINKGSIQSQIDHLQSQIDELKQKTI